MTSPNTQADADLIALRDWMEQTYKGLQPSRSTASHALEVLKTERANCNYYAAQSDITQAVAGMISSQKWAEHHADRVLKLADKIVELQKVLKLLEEK